MSFWCPFYKLKATQGSGSAAGLATQTIHFRNVFNWANETPSVAMPVWSRYETRFLIGIPKNCTSGEWNSTKKQELLEAALRHPGAVWTMFNEPWKSHWGGEGGCTDASHNTVTLSAAWAAGILDEAVTLIKSVDLSAKIACCGLTELKGDPNNSDPSYHGDQEWFEKFVTAYKNNHGGAPPLLDFIHMHIYALRYWENGAEHDYAQGTCASPSDCPHGQCVTSGAGFKYCQVSNFLDWRVLRDMYMNNWYNWYQTSASLSWILLFYNWIESPELDSGIGGSELPHHLDARLVAAVFPGSDFTDQRRLVWCI